MPPSDPLAFLFSLERLGMKFGLENMRRLCGALDHPERTFSAVHVAGTNGKGSVTAMTETALRAAGHRTARYTSPHLVRLEERFVIDGNEVATDRLRAAAARVQRAAEDLVATGALEAPPTFFECTTAIAFELFRDAGIDLAVLEVGLGGRLDATNVITPAVTAITSIDFDHQAQLGGTIESIAHEKAGIIKPQVPVVCGPLPDAAVRVIEQVASSLGSRVVHAPQTVRMGTTSRDDRSIVSIEAGSRSIEHVRLALRGRHQMDNASVAVALLDELDHLGWSVPDAAIRAGLSDATWPGRLEAFNAHGVDVLIDAAHNPAGARALADYLQQSGWSPVTLVFGAMQDKDAAGMIDALAPCCGAMICTTPATPRAMPAAELARIAARRPDAPAQIEVVDDPRDALAQALRQADARSGPARVVVAGSIFLIGPLRDILR